MIELQTAALCPLTAACYDNRVRRSGWEPPELRCAQHELAMADCEPNGEELVRQEGWTYLPKSLSG